MMDEMNESLKKDDDFCLQCVCVCVCVCMVLFVVVQPTLHDLGILLLLGKIDLLPQCFCHDLEREILFSVLVSIKLLFSVLFWYVICWMLKMKKTKNEIISFLKNDVPTDVLIIEWKKILKNIFFCFFFC